MKNYFNYCIFIAFLFVMPGLAAQVNITVYETSDQVTLQSSALDLVVQKNPWKITVKDKDGTTVFSEKENNVFINGTDYIAGMESYTATGYDTIIKRDPPLYHLYDESVIIGENFRFSCTSELGKDVTVDITFRSPSVFSVWMTLGGDAETVTQRFGSDASEHFFGLGECWDAQSLDLKGLSVSMNNRTGTPDQGGYVPFYISSKGYGILVDNYLAVNFDFTSDDGVSITAPPIAASVDSAGYFKGTSMLYYFYYGPDLLDVIDRFTEHVSRPALPPSWALFTTWQWRNTINEAQTYDDMAGMRDEDIPCGLIWIDRPWAQGAENMPPPFEWQADRFPNGPQMCQDLLAEGYKSGVWVAVNLYGTFADSMNYKLLKSDTRDFLVRDQVQMYKIDRGNLQSQDPLFTCQAYYEAWEDVFGEDFVTLPRTVANRAQQYVSGKWPGDNDNTYEYPSGIKANIAAMLNLAIAGFPFWGADTGGFPDPPGNQVTIRWSQFSTFCAIFEVAGTPYSYDQPYRDLYRTYVELYTRLFPYRWTYARLAHEKGHPMTRALALQYPDDADGYNQKFEYLFGEWILVAPMVDATEYRDVYLPEGKWIDWWDGTEYEGPVTVSGYHAPLERIPLFARAGAIIPMIESQETWMGASTDPLTLRIYPDEASSFRLLGETIVYPGKTAPYTDLQGLDIHCTMVDSTIAVSTGSFDHTLICEIHVPGEPLSVTYNGTALQAVSSTEFESASEGYYYAADSRGVIYAKVSEGMLEENTLEVMVHFTGTTDKVLRSPSFDIRPNPVEEASMIFYELESAEEVHIVLTDLTGRNIKDIAGGEFGPGAHTLHLDPGKLTSGIYIVRFEAGDYRMSKEVVVK